MRVLLTKLSNTVSFGISYPYSFRVIKRKKNKIEIIIKKYRRTATRHKQINEWKFILK